MKLLYIILCILFILCLYSNNILYGAQECSNISSDMIDKIDAVYNKNVSYLNDGLKKQAYYTKEYTKGRYLFSLGIYSSALNSFLKSRLSKRIEFKTKSYIMIFLSIVNKLIRGN